MEGSHGICKPCAKTLLAEDANRMRVYRVKWSFGFSTKVLARSDDEAIEIATADHEERPVGRRFGSIESVTVTFDKPGVIGYDLC